MKKAFWETEALFFIANLLKKCYKYSQISYYEKITNNLFSDNRDDIIKQLQRNICFGRYNERYM